MRFVIGVGGETASDSSLSISVLDGRPVLGMRDLAPEGLSATWGDVSPLERAEVLKRFQQSGDDSIVLLAGYRALSFMSTLAGEDGVCAGLVFDDPVAHIARRLEEGGDLSDAAKDWIKISTVILRLADEFRGRIRLFSAADIRNAPHEFSYLCENELGIRLAVEARAAPLLERALAAGFAAAKHEVREIEAELLVRCESFRAPVDDALEMSALALERLRSLYASEAQAAGAQKDNALLREQLRLAQHKAETYYRHAQASEWADTGEVARLTSELDYARHEIAAIKKSLSWKVTAPLRASARILRGGAGALRRVLNVKALISEGREVSMLKKSDLFDAQWYLRNYPDVAKLRIDPARHYLRYGAKEGRSPSAKFDSGKYLKSHPDVATAGINPLIHYIKYGHSEARAA